MSFRIGDIVGDYDIVDVVGAGGAGQVFRVQHRITGRVEAMKVLLEGRGSETESAAQRFLREIKLQASLDHPNIASVHNAFWEKDELVMVMELVNGESLDRVIAHSPMPMGKVLRYAVQSLIALEYAHSRGITHRDIKPENIMVTPEGVVKLMDFGLAKDRNDPKMTEMGVAVGSLFYISPEQARGLPTVDHRTDVYSFGSVLYEMTTGERPFQHNNSYDLLQAAVVEDPPPPSSIVPEIPEALESVILRAMSKEPDQRFQSAKEFRRTIEAIVRNPRTDVANAAPDRRSRRAGRAQRRPMELRRTGRRQTVIRAALVVISAGVLSYLGMRALTGTEEAAEAAPPAPVVQAAPAKTAPPPKKTQPPETGGSRNGFVLRETMRIEQTPTALAFSRGGDVLAAGLANGEVRTWNPNTGKSGPVLSGSGGKIGAVTVNATSGRVAAVDAGGAAYVWPVSGSSTPQSLPAESPARLLRFSESGQRLAIAADDGSIRVWDLESGEDWTFKGAKHVPQAIAFSPAGPMMAVSGANKIALWGVGLTDKGETLSASGPEARAIAFSSNGLEMAAGIGSAVVAWDMPTRRPSKRTSLSGNVVELAYSDKDGWIAVTADSKLQRLWVWRVDKSQNITSIRLPEPAVAVALSSKADRLAAATAAGEIHYWDTLPALLR